MQYACASNEMDETIDRTKCATAGERNPHDLIFLGATIHDEVLKVGELKMEKWRVCGFEGQKRIH